MLEDDNGSGLGMRYAVMISKADVEKMRGKKLEIYTIGGYQIFDIRSPTGGVVQNSVIYLLVK